MSRGASWQAFSHVRICFVNLFLSREIRFGSSFLRGGLFPGFASVFCILSFSLKVFLESSEKIPFLKNWFPRLRSIYADFPAAIRWEAIVLCTFPMGFRIFCMVLLGARERRAVSVGSSRLTLMRSARYPAAASSSSEAPGIVFTWMYPLKWYRVRRSSSVSHIFSMV